MPSDHMPHAIDGLPIFLICVGIRYHSTDRWSIDPDLMIRMLMVGYCSVIRSAMRPYFMVTRAIVQAIAVCLQVCGRGAGRNAPQLLQSTYLAVADADQRSLKRGRRGSGL